LRRSLALAGAAVLVFALVAAVLVAVTGGADTSYDVWAFWLPKAKAIYYFHGLDTGLGGFTAYANPQYPPGVPAAAAAAFHFMGSVSPRLLPLQQTVISVAFVGSAIDILRRSVSPDIFYPIIALLVVAPQFWDRIGTVLPDQDVGYCIALTTLAWLTWLEDHHPGWLYLGAVFLGAATSMKSEGLLLGLIFTAVAIIASLSMRGRAGIRSAALLVGPATIVPWLIWLHAHRQPLQSDVYSWGDLLRPDYLADRLGRLTYASGRMADSVFGSHWLFVAPAALLALLMMARLRPWLAAALLGWFVIGFVGLASVYWISPLDAHYYVETSAARVVATLPLVAGTITPFLFALASRPRESLSASHS
jgi:hypothetical protein